MRRLRRPARGQLIVATARVELALALQAPDRRNAGKGGPHERTPGRPQPAWPGCSGRAAAAVRNAPHAGKAAVFLRQRPLSGWGETRTQRARQRTHQRRYYKRARQTNSSGRAAPVRAQKAELLFFVRKRRSAATAAQSTRTPKATSRALSLVNAQLIPRTRGSSAARRVAHARALCSVTHASTKRARAARAHTHSRARSASVSCRGSYGDADSLCGSR